MVAPEVPVEGDEIITLTELWIKIKANFSSKADHSQHPTSSFGNLFHNIFEFFGVEFEDDQTYSPVSSEMEMSIHDGEKKGSHLDTNEEGDIDCNDQIGRQ